MLAKCKAHPVSANENDGECIYCVLAEETITMLNTDNIAFKTYKSTRIDQILQLLELQRALKVIMKFAIVCIASILSSTVYGLVPSIVREIVDLEVC